MEMSRRAALGAAIIAPSAAFARGDDFGGWPHPEVGTPLGGRTIPNVPDGVITGHVQIGDRVVHPGRFYTKEEWSRVQADVEPYVKRVFAAAFAGL
jgi:hypothetical protein